jgi:hypothetical protein
MDVALDGLFESKTQENHLFRDDDCLNKSHSSVDGHPRQNRHKRHLRNLWTCLNVYWMDCMGRKGE